MAIPEESSEPRTCQAGQMLESLSELTAVSDLVVLIGVWPGPAMSKSLSGLTAVSDGTYPQLPFSAVFAFNWPFSATPERPTRHLRGSSGEHAFRVKINAGLIFLTIPFDPLFGRFWLFSASIGVCEGQTELSTAYPQFRATRPVSVTQLYFNAFNRTHTHCCLVPNTGERRQTAQRVPDTHIQFR